jgi:N-acetyl sugar amidotransferase
MKYCTRCVYPENHPLNLTFDEEGVCSGCRVHEEKDSLDWVERGEKLRNIFDEFRSKDGKNYDCIIPVSGARDSYFIVHVVKNIYKMHPLLVTYNKHYNTQVGIRNLAYLRTLFGCDIHTLTVSPDTVKKITRSTLQKNASMYWHCIAGQTVFPVSTAVRFKIPLIVWGAHQGCDQVGMFSHLDEVEMTRKYRKDHDLMGYEVEDLVREFPSLSQLDMAPFRYPHDKEIESVGVRGIYLSNYLRWDSKAQHEEMIRTYGYESTLQHRTFDTYNDVDCFHYSDLHDYIKFAKWGYGKVSDHATREIRLHRLSREDAISLVQHWQNKEPDPYRLSLFLDWIGIQTRELYEYVNQCRDPNVWTKNEYEQFELLDSVANHRNVEASGSRPWLIKDKCDFVLSESKIKNSKEDKYILVGRGWVDI